MTSSNTERLTNPGRDVPHGLRAVEHDDPFGKAVGEPSIPIPYGRVKCAVLPLHPVGSRVTPLDGGLTIDEEDEAPVGHEVGDGDVQLEHAVDAQPARDPLVGERRVEEAI